MAASLLLLLLGFAARAAAQIDMIDYTPRVTDEPIAGRTTATTFALEPPYCVFNQFVNTSDNIWLVVTFINATSKFKNPATPKDIPPYEELFTSYGYMTMKTTVNTIPCKNDHSVLRVGNEASCKNDDTRTHCNGPLPSSGSFRVKFLAMDDKGAIAETRWSQQINLMKPLDWNKVDTWPGRREGDMIVITVILSALCGVVTIGLFSTVVYECVKAWKQGPTESVSEQRPDPEPSFQSSRYDTHHIPPAPPAPPPPPSLEGGGSP